MHEFLGDSIKLDCVVSGGQATIEAVPQAVLATTCPCGPATALIRPHEIELLADPGPARVTSVHTTGALKRIRLMLADRVVEVLQPLDSWTPAIGQACAINLSRARVYGAGAP